MWNGAFIKHRLGSGDIKNHLEVVSIEPLAEEGYNDRLSDEVDRREIFAGGTDESVPYLVTIGFVNGSGEQYEFIVWMDEQDAEVALDLVAHEIQP